MTCPHCMYFRVPPGAQYCPRCGAALFDVAPAAEETATGVPLAPAAANVEYAGFWTRLAALAVDGAILVVAQVVVTAASWMPLWLVTLGPGEDAFLLRTSLLVWLWGGTGPVGLLVTWAYFTIFTGLWGQTPGKMLLRLRVVDADGRVPGLGQAFLREAVGKTIARLVLLGLLWVAWDERKQGWHDKLAGTYVIHSYQPAPVRPPER